MKIDQTDVINAPVDVVYTLVKERLPDIVPYIPNIKKIDKLKETNLDGKRTRIINQWYANVEMPALVQKFLSPDLFSWKDTALWSDDEKSVHYELESNLAKNLFAAKGANFFTAKKTDLTELRLTCEIEIHADRIPGVPKLMARKVVPTIEKLIEKMLQPNMTSLGEGIKAYLAAKH